MTEGIDYRENGTIAITLDQEYVLRVPSADDVLRWDDQLNEHAEDLLDQLDAFRRKLEGLEPGDPEYRKLERELNLFTRNPTAEFRLKWLTEVFGSLAVDFPPRSDWPAWLLSNQLPRNFVDHWKTVPLVSGAKTRQRTQPNNG